MQSITVSDSGRGGEKKNDEPVTNVNRKRECVIVKTRMRVLQEGVKEKRVRKKASNEFAMDEKAKSTKGTRYICHSS